MRTWAGSILNRYHTIRTTVTETDKVGLWGARTTSTQYYEESTPLQLVDDGIDTAFCLQSTLACVQNACVKQGDVVRGSNSATCFSHRIHAL